MQRSSSLKQLPHAKSALFSNSQAWESTQGLLAGVHCAQRSLGSGADPTAWLRGEELAVSSSFVFFSDGVLMKRLALLGGLVCVLLLFALLPLPWPPPPRPPHPSFVSAA